MTNFQDESWRLKRESNLTRKHASHEQQQALSAAARHLHLQQELYMNPWTCWSTSFRKKSTLKVALNKNTIRQPEIQ